MENFKADFEKILKSKNLSEKEIAFKNLNAKEFANQGFPNKKDENWKFSDLNQIIKKEIGELKFYYDSSEKNDVSKDLFLNQIEHNKLFFVNGQLEQIDFSHEDKTKIEFLDNQNDIDEKSVENSLINLNNALVDKSFTLLIKKNYQIQNPLVIYHTTTNKLNSQNINFKELIYKPTTIMGYSANPGVIGSVLGLVLTGCLFAVQGFVSTGIEYDASGWFNF